MSARKHRKVNDRQAVVAGRRGARTLADWASKAIEPALLRRAGLTVKLLSHWPEIVGPDLAARSRPLRMKWGRRAHIGESAAPGTLVIACDGATALRVQHMSEQIADRVNATFGWRAVGRILIEQKPVAVPERIARPSVLSQQRERAIAERASPIEHERLHDALVDLGKAAALREAARDVA